MFTRTPIAVFTTAMMLTLPVFAQTPAEPSAESLGLARELVLKTAGDQAATIQMLRTPMVGLMQQMGIKQPDRAQALVQEAVLPMLTDHLDDLLARQAQSYAKLLSVEDLKAAIAFYNTPAGQDLIQAQPQLAQTKMADVSQWLGALQPELQTRVKQTLASHGWDKP